MTTYTDEQKADLAKRIEAWAAKMTCANNEHKWADRTFPEL